MPLTSKDSILTEKDELQKSQIMEAAKEVFRLHGYAKTSMDDFARLAVKSRTTVYKYYSNKDQVLQDFISLEIKQIVEIATAVIDHSSSLESKLVGYTSKKLEKLHQEFDIYTILVTEILEGSQQAAFFRTQLSKLEAVVMKDIFQQSIDKKEIAYISPDQLDFFVSVITLSLRGIEQDAFCGSPDILLEQRIQWLIGIVVRGLK